MADFRRFLHLARPMQNPWHGGGMVRSLKGRLEMTMSFNSLQTLAFSLIGAVVASSLFLSAAVGPVPII